MRLWINSFIVFWCLVRFVIGLRWLLTWSVYAIKWSFQHILQHTIGQVPFTVFLQTDSFYNWVLPMLFQNDFSQGVFQILQILRHNCRKSYSPCRICYFPMDLASCPNSCQPHTLFFCKRVRIFPSLHLDIVWLLTTESFTSRAQRLFCWNLNRTKKREGLACFRKKLLVSHTPRLAEIQMESIRIDRNFSPGVFHRYEPFPQRISSSALRAKLIRFQYLFLFERYTTLKDALVRVWQAHLDGFSVHIKSLWCTSCSL